VDYSKLRDLLKEGKWREAEDETRELLIQAAGPAAVRRGWVYFSEVKFIPGGCYSCRLLVDEPLGTDTGLSSAVPCKQAQQCPASPSGPPCPHPSRNLPPRPATFQPPIPFAFLMPFQVLSTDA
jgi:hypothetical protein